jgi:sporulation protein YlmC with PRC-barrel domain
MKHAFATASVLALLIAGPAVAQAPAGTANGGIGSTAPPVAITAPDRAPAAGVAAASDARVFPAAAEADKYIGKDVHGMGGNDIGKIRNLLISPDGRVRAAIIEFGGSPGAGENEVAIPWDQLNITGNRIMITMTEDQIKIEPRWTRDRPGEFAEFRPYR